MKNYQVTVNGNIYQVEVQELQAGQKIAPVAAAPVAKPVAPVAAPVAAAPAPAAAPAAPVAAGATKIDAPMQGKIVGIKVNIGDNVKDGDVVILLEAMKMENEIVSPSHGKVASINVTVGQQVNAGDLMITLN